MSENIVIVLFGEFMFMLRKPSDEKINDLIAAQSNLPFSYREVGATKEHHAPAGYPINHYRKELGMGEKIFTNAAAALRSWRMYELEWTTLYPANAVVVEGKVVAVLVRHLGFWSLNPCRIVYLINENNEDVRRIGFAIGTLPAHSEIGEERFTVEWDKNSDTVCYELYAFAKPANALAKIGSPFVTYLQKRFAAESYSKLKV